MTNTYVHATVAAIGAPIAVAGSLILGALAHSAVSHAEIITEDSPGWDCRTMGNHVCGPTNSNHVAPGCYDDAASLVAAWPCFLVVDSTGNADVYTPDAR